MLPHHWDAIDRELSDHKSAALAAAAFENGRSFAEHSEGLDGRPARLVEWTGGRRPPGDQVIPADLRIDKVYLVSCKYLSKIVLNTAPARLFDGLLRPSAPHQASDWFAWVAPDEYRQLAVVAERFLGLTPSPDALAMTPDRRKEIKLGLRAHGRLLPQEMREPYAALCRVASSVSAERWRAALLSNGRRAEELLWRLLRFSSGVYFVLGVAGNGDRMRLRIDTPWDWRQNHELRSFDIEADEVGQPQVRWRATVRDREADVERVVDGHVEIRWSHGRFGAPPEAKVYLDTPHSEVPGYTPLR